MPRPIYPEGDVWHYNDSRYHYLEWYFTGDPNVTRYEVWLSETESDRKVYHNDQIPADSDYIMLPQNLEADKKYYWWVRAYYGDKPGEWNGAAFTMWD